MEPISISKNNQEIVSEEALFDSPIAETVNIGRGISRALTPQEVVNGLKFLREQVFNEENIEQVKNFLEHIETFSTTVISIWNAISTYIADRRDNAGGMRSLDLMVALHESGLDDLYDVIEMSLAQED